LAACRASSSAMIFIEFKTSPFRLNFRRAFQHAVLNRGKQHYTSGLCLSIVVKEFATKDEIIGTAPVEWSLCWTELSPCWQGRSPCRLELFPCWLELPPCWLELPAPARTSSLPRSPNR
jgi:hypothetical protein